jgi:hypothetical protein
MSPTPGSAVTFAIGDEGSERRLAFGRQLVDQTAELGQAVVDPVQLRHGRLGGGGIGDAVERRGRVVEHVRDLLADIDVAHHQVRRRLADLGGFTHRLATEEEVVGRPDQRQQDRDADDPSQQGPTREEPSIVSQSPIVKVWLPGNSGK